MKPFRRRYEEELNTLIAYQTAVNEAAIVSITDLDGKIVFANDKFREVSGYSEDELIGNTHKLINSGFHSDDFFKELWQTISSGKPWRGQIRNKKKNGDFYWVDTVITPVFDAENKKFQYLSVRNLITETKENEAKLLRFQQELIQREQQLRDAQEVAKIGSWHLQSRGNVLEWSDEAYKIFDIAKGTPITYEQFLERVHPDDRVFVNENWEAALKGNPYNIVHRIIVNGKLKWVKEIARLEFDASHSFLGATGTVQDITEIKKIEDNLKKSELLYRDLFDSIPVPVAIVDRETLRFRMVNETAKTLYGYTANEFLQLTLFDIRVEKEHGKLHALIDNINFAHDTSIRTHRKKNGDLLQIEPVIREIVYEDRPAYLISVIDMTEKLKMQRQLIQANVTRQKEINRASLDAQEENSATIGRELHDNVNQLLVASLIYLKRLHTHTKQEAEIKDKTLELISNAMAEIRKLSRSMVPPSLKDFSLKDCLENLSNDLKSMNKQVDFNVSLQEEYFDESFRINIYRIVQEQFSNIVKYSKATYVKISLKQEASTLTLEIIDNGSGFDVNASSGGIGLTNIAHRSETYNGESLIESSPGNGCRVFIVFKL